VGSTLEKTTAARHGLFSLQPPFEVARLTIHSTNLLFISFLLCDLCASA
jgi:hypothetical protein